MKTSLIYGIFDFLHSGHIRLFEFAKKKSDYLIVALEGDKINKVKSFNTEIKRQKEIKKLGIVDKCIIYNISLDKLIKKVNPDFVIKGKEFENSYNPEFKIINDVKSELIFNSGETLVYSDNLKPDNIDLGNISLNEDKSFLQANKINKLDISKTIKQFSKVKIAIFGDIIVDKYVNAKPLGISQEDPLVTFKPIKSEFFLGGAGIVAAHARQLGAKTEIFTVIGKDNTNNFILDKIKKYGLNKKFIFIDKNRNNTVKTRFVSNGNAQFKITELDETFINKKFENKIINNFSKISDSIDMVVFSDFSYGVLTSTIINKISEICMQKKIKIFADCQSSSQFGDISKYINCDALTPTEYEARLSLNDNYSGMRNLGTDLLNKTNSKNILIKLGPEGVLIFNNNNKSIKIRQVHALNYYSQNSSGAGDSFLVSAALSYAINEDIYISSYIGSLVAAIQISRVGNLPITQNELYKLLQQI